jgi:hypothetical protein
MTNRSRDSSAGIAAGRGRLPAGARYFSLLQTGLQAYTASYSIGTEGLFDGGKAVGA